MCVMRRLCLLALLVLLCAIPVHGQSTTVSGTISDAGSQVWAGGTYKFIFTPNPQYPVGPYTWTGGVLNQVIPGTLDGSGHYSVSIPSNSAITPVNSTWVLQITPNATSQSFSTAPTNIAGATQTLNATPPAIAITWANPPGPAISAYADGEIVGTLPTGAEYFNVTTGFTEVWNGSAWVNQGNGFSSAGNLGDIQIADGAGGFTVAGDIAAGSLMRFSGAGAWDLEATGDVGIVAGANTGAATIVMTAASSLIDIEALAEVDIQLNQGVVKIGNGNVLVRSLPVFANNAAAIAGGLVAGNLYRTGANPDPVSVVH
jgi:hypothetical protein